MGHFDYAPDLFLLAHDPFTGQPEIRRDLLGYALAAAELAHLVVDSRLRITEDQLIAVESDPRRSEPDNDLAAGDPDPDIDNHIVDRVRQQDSEHGIATWLTAIADIVYNSVSGDLVRNGMVRRAEPVRRMGGRRTGERFPALDVLAASSPRLRLNHMIREPTSTTLAGAVHIALLEALRIERLLEVRMSDDFRDQLHRNLPAQLQMLVAGTVWLASTLQPATPRP